MVGLRDVLRVALARASWFTDIVTTNIFMSKLSSWLSSLIKAAECRFSLYPPNTILHLPLHPVRTALSPIRVVSVIVLKREMCSLLLNLSVVFHVCKHYSP
jgi:hypothetical protein